MRSPSIMNLYPFFYNVVLCASLFAMGACKEKAPAEQGKSTNAPNGAVAKPATDAKGGGTMTYDDGHGKTDAVTFKIGRAFVHTEKVGDGYDENDKPIFKTQLLDITLFNDGVKDADCSTDIRSYSGAKLLGGNHYGVFLTPDSILMTNIYLPTPSEPQTLVNSISGCVFHPNTFSGKLEQTNGCPFAGRNVSMLRVSPGSIQGDLEFSFGAGGMTTLLKGKFVATICPAKSAE
jgi:hypothetical protein